MIRFEDVHKGFNGKQVLAGVNFEVKQGETYVIMGPSGTGKSVALKHIIAAYAADAGRVLVEGEDVAKLDRAGVKRVRQKIGYLFQDGALINWLSVFENVALPLRENTKLPNDEIERRVREKLAMVQLQEAGEKMPDIISGGMRKRVGLARALVTEPKIILYDEPTSALDPEISASINILIRDLQNRLGVTSIVVTHSINCAFTVGDRIGFLDKGKVLVEGTPEEIRYTKNERLKGFLGDMFD